MSQNMELLNRVDIFQSLDDNIKIKFLDIMEKVSVHAGEDVAVKGGQGFYFFILVWGTAILSFDDGKAVVFNESGDFIGFEMLLAQGKYKATLTSLTDSDILFVDYSKFLEIIQEDSSMAESMRSRWEAFLLKKAPFVEKLDLFRNQI